ncbi:hypothetical protein Tsubulata_004538 [Turnera subulata]|uniref:Uncharacterized protein n=1 Tax=Turnera subulata TaxID=218843 RepID=A0A9Q0JBC2_9ROSI|nr:hypothetical protein Tsubulata_004538 [Turnera subulata]
MLSRLPYTLLPNNTPPPPLKQNRRRRLVAKPSKRKEGTRIEKTDDAVPLSTGGGKASRTGQDKGGHTKYECPTVKPPSLKSNRCRSTTTPATLSYITPHEGVSQDEWADRRSGASMFEMDRALPTVAAVVAMVVTMVVAIYNNLCVGERGEKVGSAEVWGCRLGVCVRWWRSVLIGKRVTSREVEGRRERKKKERERR